MWARLQDTFILKVADGCVLVGYIYTAHQATTPRRAHELSIEAQRLWPS